MLIDNGILILSNKDVSLIFCRWVDPSFNNYTIMNLEENEEYAISVIPYFNDVNGNTSTIRVLTWSDVPGAAPLNVTARVVNTTVRF